MLLGVRNQEMEKMLMAIAQAHPSGLACAGFVTGVLKTGYIFIKVNGDSLPQSVRASLLSLCEDGVLYRHEEDDGRRLYEPAAHSW